MAGPSVMLSWLWKMSGWGGGDPFEVARKTGKSQLLTIPFSHYVELSKWALEANGIEYHERAYMPMIHAAPVVAARSPGGHINPTTFIHNPYWSVPFLVRPDGTVGNDSWSILETCFGIQSGDVEWQAWKEAVDLIGSEMVHASWCGYAYDGVDHGDVPLERFDETLKWQMAWWKSRLGPMMADMCRNGRLPMASKKGVERARQGLRSLFDDVEARLAKGAAKTPPEQYLSGTTFGPYDLSFSALCVIAVLPPETTSASRAALENAAGTLPPQGVHAGFLNEFRDRPAAQHIARCFREHRNHRTVRLEARL